MTKPSPYIPTGTVLGQPFAGRQNRVVIGGNRNLQGTQDILAVEVERGSGSTVIGRNENNKGKQQVGKVRVEKGDDEFCSSDVIEIGFNYNEGEDQKVQDVTVGRAKNKKQYQDGEDEVKNAIA